jgi:hypothetical protein
VAVVVSPASTVGSFISILLVYMQAEARRKY